MMNATTRQKQGRDFQINICGARDKPCDSSYRYGSRPRYAPRPSWPWSLHNTSYVPIGASGAWVSLRHIAGIMQTWAGMNSYQPAQPIHCGRLPDIFGGCRSASSCTRLPFQGLPVQEHISPFPDNWTIRPLAGLVNARSEAQRLDKTENGRTFCNRGKVVWQRKEKGYKPSSALQGWTGGIRCVEQGREGCEADGRPQTERLPTEAPDREDGSLHNAGYVDMRYNRINSIFQACAKPGTAKRTHNPHYVKARSHDGEVRLPAGRGGGRR